MFFCGVRAERHAHLPERHRRRGHLSAPNVCLIDIETAPITGLSWTIYDTNLIHVIEPTYILCYAIKWLGQKKITTRALCDYPHYEKNKKSDKALLADLWKDLDKADVVIAHNGDAFDIKKINSRLVVHGMPAPSPFRTVDTLKVARRNFKFDSNKLDNIGRYLEVGRKMPHTGKDLWIGCMAGDPKSWRIMRRYNAQDIVLLENVYQKIKSWDQSHPNLALFDGSKGCPTCRSDRIVKHGIHTTKTRRVQRYKCQGCGSWFLGESVK